GFVYTLFLIEFIEHWISFVTISFASYISQSSCKNDPTKQSGTSFRHFVTSSNEFTRLINRGVNSKESYKFIRARKCRKITNLSKNCSSSQYSDTRNTAK